MKSLILHDAEVRALLDTGEVTVVRAIKLAPCWFDDNGDLRNTPYWKGEELVKQIACPYATPSERRWVRECIYRYTGIGWLGVDGVTYRATGTPVMGEGPCGSWSGRALCNWTWKRNVLAATHMPQWASRLTAECASVTVQRREGVWEWQAVYRRVE